MSKKAKVESGPNDHVVDLYDGETLEDVRRYGQWREARNGRYLLPALLSGSDYSGSLVERANYQKFSDEYKSGLNEWWVYTPGGHGTYGILIDMQGVPDDVSTEVAEFLNGLNDYPLADEELHSEMKMEAQEEAWKSWAERDFAKDLQKKFANDPKLETVLDEVLSDDDLLVKLRTLFDDAQEKANVYWENQQGDEMYIDMKRVVAKVTKADVEYFLVEGGIR
jgi:hypothetical protein